MEPRVNMNSLEKLDELKKIDIDKVRQEAKDENEEIRYSRLYLPLKTYLTYNNFLYGFTQEKCNEEHSFGGFTANHYVVDEQKFICDSCLRAKYS